MTPSRASALARPAEPLPEALRGRCECEFCRQGVTTTLHADPSHDQRLVQQFTVGAAELRIVGGTTKCARVALAYALTHPDAFAGRRVLELGAGSGLVAVGLAVGLGCDVTATDQEPVLDLLQANIDQNTDPAHHRVRAAALQWGEPVDAWPRYDLIVGADLNFARENMAPLLATLCALARDPAQAIVYASVRRAAWESEFFEALERAFAAERLAEVDEIQVHRYVRRPGPPSAL